MKKVLVLGSINIDFVSFVSLYPQSGETHISNDFGIFQGGKGVLSDFALSSIQEHLIDITGITKSQKNSTGSASIQVNTQGQNSIVIYPGANGEVSEDFIVRQEKFFDDAS